MAEDNQNFALNLAGSKLRSRLSGHLNESAASGTSAFAKRQLEKLGWKEGEGLGKRGTGITTHIRAVKRADEQGGLGKSSVDPAISQSIGNEWWKNSVGDTLARLGKKNKKKKKEKSKKIYTDQELFEATGGARFGMRAQSRQTGKWQRTETNQGEDEALAKVEWDGMTAPKIVLKEEKSKKKRKREEDGEESQEERKKRKDAKKKRRKEEKESGEKTKKKNKSKD